MSDRTPSSTYLGTRYITDGSLYGVVKLTTVDAVQIVDRVTGKQHLIGVRVARRMTPSEIEHYNSLPTFRDPPADVLAMRAAEIRGLWSDGVRRERSQPKYLPFGEHLSV